MNGWMNEQTNEFGIRVTEGMERDVGPERHVQSKVFGWMKLELVSWWTCACGPL